MQPGVIDQTEVGYLVYYAYIWTSYELHSTRAYEVKQLIANWVYGANLYRN